MSDYSYPETRRLAYGDAIFIPVCQLCGRYVKADEQMHFRVVFAPGGWADYVVPVEPNATCSRDGRVAMIWEGYA